MAVTYSKLWKLLIDRKMKKKDLKQKANLTGYAMNKLSRDENVSTEVIAKLCECLDCKIEDIMEIIVDNKN